MSFLEDDMIAYVEHPKISTKKLLELIDGYSKVVQYEVNIKKSIVFLYSNMNN